jgi:hypothetical protein
VLTEPTISQAELEAVRLDLQRRGVRVTLAGMLKSSDAAAFLGKSPKTLRNWRSDGAGPVFETIGGGGTFYPLAGLLAFVRSGGNRPNRPAPSRRVLAGAPGKAQSDSLMEIRKSTLRTILPAPVADLIRDVASQKGITTSDLLSDALRHYPPVQVALQSRSPSSPENPK